MTGISKIARAGMLLAFGAAVSQAYEFGPNPGYTGAPGDNAKACIASGCHVGTPNSGSGNVKISLPSGNSGTYTPGQAMQILVQITDSTKVSYGFQMTARSGSAGTTQAGDFSTVDTKTQVLCSDGSTKANGKTCSSSFPLEYIEHTLTGWSSSIATTTKGSYTYTVTWTPPATATGTITLYAAANCGTGGPSVAPTDVYTTNLALTPASATPTPSITSVKDAESGRTAITGGQWVAIYGTNLAAPTANRIWNASSSTDFPGGTGAGAPLPTKLDGVSVTIGGQTASVYYISPTQVNVQAPTTLTGSSTPVVLSYNNGTTTTTSAAVNVNVVPSSPSFFGYQWPQGTGAIYPSALHFSDNALVGDPAVLAGTEKAHPGEILELFANGLGPSTGGIILNAFPVFTGALTVTVTNAQTQQTTNVQVLGAVLISAGLFQINVTLPSNLATGSYNLSMTTATGTTADDSVTILLPVGP